MLKAYPISAKQQLDTQCNLAMAKLKLRHITNSDEDWPLHLVAGSYHHASSIRRDLHPNDVAWEKFYYDANRFASIAAAMEWHRQDGVKPEMAVIIEIKLGVKDSDILDLSNLYDSKFIVYTWQRSGWGQPYCCISLTEVPDEDLTDFLAIARELSNRPLEFAAISASPLTWTD